MEPKKILSRVLIGLNALIILGLLLLSGLLLYFSNAETPTLLGNQALIQSSEEDGARLILYQAGELPAEGGQALLRTPEGEVVLGTEVRIDPNGFLVCTSPSGVPLSLDPSEPEFLGRVTSVNGFLGGLFAYIASPNQIAITYIIIAISFLVCVLILVVVYIVSTHKPLVLEGEEDIELLRSLLSTEDMAEDEAKAPSELESGPEAGPDEPPPAACTTRDAPNWAFRRERTGTTSEPPSPFQQTPLTRQTPVEEDVKIYRPHDAASASPRSSCRDADRPDRTRYANQYAAPHILRSEAGRVAAGREDSARSESRPPTAEWSQSRRAAVPSCPEPAAPPSRRKEEVIIREHAGDPYDQYDVGPSIDELLQELEKLE